MLDAKFEAMPAPKPAKPLTESEAEEWVQAIIEKFYSHPVSTHPLMRKFRDQSYPDHGRAVAFFAHQIYAFARDFRAVCGITIGKLKCCDDVRDNLVYHLAEENGRYPEKDVAFLATQNISADSFVGKPHIDLWASLLDKLGITPTEDSFIAEAKALDMWMINHVRMNTATSNSAMIMGIELWSKDMGKDMLPALASAGLTREDAIFFELHNVIDDEIHVADIGKDLVSLLTNQPPENSLKDLKADAISPAQSALVGVVVVFFVSVVVVVLIPELVRLRLLATSSTSTHVGARASGEWYSYKKLH